MFKKKDLLMILVLCAVLVLSLLFIIFTRDYISIGGVRADIDDKNRTIYVSLPEGSLPDQKVQFNFLFKNNNVFIKKLSYGPKEIEDPSEEKIESGTFIDLGGYISHSKLIVRSAFSDIEYDLWVTTGDVPIITIESDYKIVDEPKVDSTISILSADSGHRKYNIASEIELIDVWEDIPKESYSLNIKENSITGDAPEILDFKTSNRFRLSSSYTDRSFLRQKLAYDIFRQFSDKDLAPESRYAELYVNNSYKGLYLISERVDRNMFSLSNYKKSQDTHSVIYEAVNSKADFTNGEEGFSQVEPDMDTDGPYPGPLLKLADLIVNAERKEFLKDIEDMVDMESVLDNHILFLLAGCTEEQASNNYIYRGNENGARFSFSPGSHYLSSFGNDDPSGKADAEAVFYGSRLFNRLYEDGEYRERLKQRWNSLRKKVLYPENIQVLIDESTGFLSDAYKRDIAKWPFDRDTENGRNSLGHQTDQIKRFIEERLDHLDNYINNPPLIKIGGQYARIDEESKTIFCALPAGSDTVQEISWEFEDDTEIYLEALSFGEIGVYKNDFSKYSEILANGKNTGDITIFIESPKKNEDHPELDVLEEKIRLSGWAVDPKSEEDTGVNRIFVFSGPEKNKETFLGEAVYEIPRTDVAEYFEKPGYRLSGFELYINTFHLENGNHDLHIYAFDDNGDYSLSIFPIEVDNEDNEVDKIMDSENIKLSNGKSYDLVNFIYHGILTIENNNTYDIWITTSDVPLMVVDTNDQIINNESRISTDVLIMYCDSNEKNFINRQYLDFIGSLSIKIRGKSSQGFPKKQYSVEIIDEMGNDLNVSLLGMPSEADWILAAPYSDKTLMRNALAFEISNQIGAYASRTRFLELFINDREDLIAEGGYKGVYVLTERIKRDNDRVNIQRLELDDIDISGGYILEISSLDRLRANESFFTTDNGTTFINVYPDNNRITTEQKEWIANYINKLETALFSKDFLDEEEGYRKYLDIDSLVCYMLVNELFKNRGIFWASTYFHKDKNGKLMVGPIWDFNLSAGKKGTTPQANNTTGWRYEDKLWIDRIFQDKFFLDEFIGKWKSYRKSSLSDENIGFIIDQNVSILNDAQIRNFKKWDTLGKGVWPSCPPIPGTYEEEIEKLKNWFFERTRWMDENIDFLMIDS